MPSSRSRDENSLAFPSKATDDMPASQVTRTSCRQSARHNQNSTQMSPPTTTNQFNSQLTRSPRPAAMLSTRRLAVALILALQLGLFGAVVQCQQPEAANRSTTQAPPTNSSTAPTLEPTTTQIPAIHIEQYEPATNSNNSADSSTASNQQMGVKLKPVNFTLVDQIFAASLSDDEVVKRWKNMDAQLQDGIRSILKLIFPQIVAISQDAKVSGECSGGILKWILSLRNLRSWAIKMLDATGKPTAGMFQGSLTLFGNYRQCLDIRAPDEDEIEITEQFEEYFRGQFCVIHLKPWLPVKKPFYHLNSTIEPLLRKNYKYYEKTLYDELAEIAIAFNFLDIRLDLCVPSTCTVADIQRVAELLSGKLEMRAKVMRCDIAPRQSSHTQLILDSLDRPTLYWLILPLALIALVSLATILRTLQWTFLACFSKPRGQAENGTSTLTLCLDRMSISGIISRLFSIDEAHKKPYPLHGLRCLFVVWFVVVQMTVELKYQYLRESLLLRDMMLTYWPFQIIINSSMLFESLIIITAFTFSVTNTSSKLTSLMVSLFKAYCKLMPAIVTLVALTIVTPLIKIQSPVWSNFVDRQSELCKETGYVNLMFLQNFLPYEKICLPHTWLFCVELQLIILSLPIVLLFNRNLKRNSGSLSSKPRNLEFSENLASLLKSKVGLISIILIVIGMSLNFASVYLHQLPPSWFYTFPDVEHKDYYFGKYLTKTWTHLAAFLVGLVAGHACRVTLHHRRRQLSASGRAQQQQIMHQEHLASQFTRMRSPSSKNHSDSGIVVHSSASTIMELDQSSMNKRRDSSDSSLDSSERHSSNVSESGSGPVPVNGWSRAVTCISQIVSLIVIFVIIFGTHFWSTQELPSALVSAIYDSISRLVWSLALVCIMVNLCLPSALGPRYRFSLVSRLFSHPICVVLGRLSVLAYLVSPYINAFILAVEEQTLFPSLFLIFHVILGNIVITYSVALLFAILIERPVGVLTCVWRRGGGPAAEPVAASQGATKKNSLSEISMATDNGGLRSSALTMTCAARADNSEFCSSCCDLQQ